jgi:hypothetical protein
MTIDVRASPLKNPLPVMFKRLSGLPFHDLTSTSSHEYSGAHQFINVMPRLPDMPGEFGGGNVHTRASRNSFRRRRAFLLTTAL